MRLNVQFSLNSLILPLNYNHIIQAFILDLIDNAEYRNFVHNEGFSYKKRKYKLFSFSRLNGKFSLNQKDKTIEFFDNVSLKISSHDKNLIQYCADSLLFKDDFELLGQKIHVEKLEYDDLEIKNDKIKVKTLSPITVYSTMEQNSSKKTVYFSPNDDNFSKLIRENLIKKYLAYYDSYLPKEISNDEFVIKEANQKRSKMIITKYKNFIIKGWHGTFVIQGNPTLLKIGYDSGFGAKNSQGFGLVEVI
ncbi:CRISPR-associated protein [Petrotoga mexicana DSM 14811]|uniref:CRISPR-associated endoribonuclease n=1 Tax=Petrotoga mexicana DSM 14811 TaxID=1122954 RepID=A0A2K1P8H6_9BACT|nr:CRISPR-associated endoribonuclease Cas6 [Petrotoga mexicana]PNR99093.1 CRISPR-associated protein [Petrotoga mexicana DSM 14811]